jgi:hypothetical protein
VRDVVRLGDRLHAAFAVQVSLDYAVAHAAGFTPEMEVSTGGDSSA